MKGPANLIHKVHEYMKQKASGYARVPENTWSKDNRKEVDTMTPAEMERIIKKEHRPFGARLAHSHASEMLSDSEPRKAGKAVYPSQFGP